MSTPRRPADRIMLVDGHSVAFRAYHALPDTLRDAVGRPANALYGFVNILFRVLQDHRPSHAAVTFDRGPSFRADLFAGYKASRPPGPVDFAPQVEGVRSILGTLAVPVYEVAGFEADDLLATLARQARAARLDVEVLSGDLDILQLVRPGVRVITPGKTFAEPIVYDGPRVVQRYGIPPTKLRDWKALVGDTSDDVPGVAGVGKKSATELLQRFDGLEAIYDHLETIASTRARNALAAGREMALLSQRLVTLRDDVPVELDLETARWGGFDVAAARRAFEALGFRPLADRIPAL